MYVTPKETFTITTLYGYRTLFEKDKIYEAIIMLNNNGYFVKDLTNKFDIPFNNKDFKEYFEQIYNYPIRY